MNALQRRRHIHAIMRMLGYTFYRWQAGKGYSSWTWKGDKQGMTIVVGELAILSVSNRAYLMDEIQDRLKEYGTITILGNKLYIEFPTEGKA